MEGDQPATRRITNIRRHSTTASFISLTNKDAENFKVVRAPASDPSEKNWKDFIPHNPAIKIDDISFFKDYAVVSEVENGSNILG